MTLYDRFENVLARLSHDKGRIKVYVFSAKTVDDLMAHFAGTKMCQNKFFMLYLTDQMQCTLGRATDRLVSVSDINSRMGHNDQVKILCALKDS